MQLIYEIVVCLPECLFYKFKCQHSYFSAPQEVADSAAFRNSSVTHCPTPGCHGIGNIKGPRYPTHNSLEACPYSPRNMGSESLLPDRIQGSFKRQENIDRGNSYHLK